MLAVGFPTLDPLSHFTSLLETAFMQRRTATVGSATSIQEAFVLDAALYFSVAHRIRQGSRPSTREGRRFAFRRIRLRVGVVVGTRRQDPADGERENETSQP
jgi:hypothetical protein